MKSHFYHIQININFENIEFYKDLMKFLGWTEIFEDNAVVGFKSDSNGDVWFTASKNIQAVDYDTIGMNHLSFKVETQKNIDEVVKYLKSKKVNALFDTPRHRPEFSASEKDTYYQVIFESPDKIQIEVVYIGSKK